MPGTCDILAAAPLEQFADDFQQAVQRSLNPTCRAQSHNDWCLLGKTWRLGYSIPEMREVYWQTRVVTGPEAQTAGTDPTEPGQGAARNFYNAAASQMIAQCHIWQRCHDTTPTSRRSPARCVYGVTTTTTMGCPKLVQN